ncbi:glycosyltransferase involved in cell wall biosynthesis [Streptococcus rupicaprae]|uniref:Glycosyltransferase involved in cell wall biosynthesis n=1 Tax=Streptococcus rupicaprae TaxID=759619 RepID=A0ABV2FG60_9STRE
MSHLRFDIIVPIYNIQDELEACLASLASQTYPHFTVIMVDDGSKDDSHLIAKSYAEKDGRFHYFLKENGGLSDARNFGLAQAQHDYVLFIDGDDYLENNTLDVLASHLKDNDLDVLEFNGWYVENGEKTSRFNNHYIDSGVVKNGRDYFVDNVKAGCMYAAACFKVIRRSFFSDKALMFEKGLLHEDELWTPQLYLKADRIMYLDIPFYNYVQRDGSIMHQKNRDKNVKDARSIYYRLESIYDHYGLSSGQKRVLMDYLARKMLGSFYEPTTVPITPADKQYVMRHARSLKSRGQALVFSLCPKALSGLTKCIKKIVRYKK